MLSDAEVRAFRRACDDVGEPFGAMFRLLLLTGQRRDEVASAPWAEFDLAGATWRLPAARTKNERAHLVPLAPAALEIIAGSRGFRACSSRPVCPRQGRHRAAGVRLQPDQGAARRAMLAGLRRPTDATLPPWRLHDLRRTGATGMAGIGVPPHTSSMFFNHVGGSRAGVAGTIIATATTRRRGPGPRPGRAIVLGLVAGSAATVVPVARRATASDD